MDFDEGGFDDVDADAMPSSMDASSRKRRVDAAAADIASERERFARDCEDVRQRYGGLETKTLAQLIALGPPPPIYKPDVVESYVDDEISDTSHGLDTTMAMRHDRVNAQMVDIGAFIDQRRSLAQDYARYTYARLCYASIADNSVAGARVPDAQLRRLIADVEFYCCTHRHWLQDPINTPRIARYSTLTSYFVVQAHATMLVERTFEVAAFQQRFRGMRPHTLGALCDAAAVMYTGDVAADWTLKQVRDSMFVVARRWYHMTYSHELGVQLAAYVTALMNRMQHAVTVLVDATSRDVADIVRARYFNDTEDGAWFTATTANDEVAAAAGMWGANHECQGECATLFYTMLRSLRVASVMTRDELLCAPPALRLCPRARIDALIAACINERAMRDMNTFLQSVHKRASQLEPAPGEPERYVRWHKGAAYRDTIDMLNEMRWNAEIDYWMERMAFPSREAYWDEETSDTRRELVLHALVAMQFTVRDREYQWQATNVVYEFDTQRNNAEELCAFLESAYTDDGVRRRSPLIFQVLGSFMLQHEGRVYPTRRLGEAVALWFLLVDPEPFSRELRGVIRAHRLFLWENDDGAIERIDVLQDLDAPPSSAFVRV